MPSQAEALNIRVGTLCCSCTNIGYASLGILCALLVTILQEGRNSHSGEVQKRFTMLACETRNKLPEEFNRLGSICVGKGMVNNLGGDHASGLRLLSFSVACIFFHQDGAWNGRLQL